MIYYFQICYGKFLRDIYVVIFLDDIVVVIVGFYYLNYFGFMIRF